MGESYVYLLLLVFSTQNSLFPETIEPHGLFTTAEKCAEWAEYNRWVDDKEGIDNRRWLCTDKPET